MSRAIIKKLRKSVPTSRDSFCLDFWISSVDKVATFRRKVDVDNVDEANQHERRRRATTYLYHCNAKLISFVHGKHYSFLISNVRGTVKTNLSIVVDFLVNSEYHLGSGVSAFQNKSKSKIRPTHLDMSHCHRFFLGH